MNQAIEDARQSLTVLRDNDWLELEAARKRFNNSQDRLDKFNADNPPEPEPRDRNWLHQETLDRLVRAGDKGLTAMELEEQTGVTHKTWSARLSQLFTKGDGIVRHEKPRYIARTPEELAKFKAAKANGGAASK